ARERPRAPCGFAPPPIRRQPALLADDIDERILDERPPHLRTTSCVMLDRSCPVSMRGFDERLRSIVSWSRGLTGKPADIAFLISPVSHSPSRSSAMSAVIFPATTLRARRCCRLRISLILASIGERSHERNGTPRPYSCAAATTPTEPGSVRLSAPFARLGRFFCPRASAPMTATRTHPRTQRPPEAIFVRRRHDSRRSRVLALVCPLRPPRTLLLTTGIRADDAYAHAVLAQVRKLLHPASIITLASDSKRHQYL